MSAFGWLQSSKMFGVDVMVGGTMFCGICMTTVVLQPFDMPGLWYGPGSVTEMVSCVEAKPLGPAARHLLCPQFPRFAMMGTCKSMQVSKPPPKSVMSGESVFRSTTASSVLVQPFGPVTVSA